MDIEQSEKDPQLTQQTEDEFIVSILRSLLEKKVITDMVYDDAVKKVLTYDGEKQSEHD